MKKYWKWNTTRKENIFELFFSTPSQWRCGFSIGLKYLLSSPFFNSFLNIVLVSLVLVFAWNICIHFKKYHVELVMVVDGIDLPFAMENWLFLEEGPYNFLRFEYLDLNNSLHNTIHRRCARKNGKDNVTIFPWMIKWNLFSFCFSFCILAAFFPPRPPAPLPNLLLVLFLCSSHLLVNRKQMGMKIGIFFLLIRYLGLYFNFFSKFFPL